MPPDPKFAPHPLARNRHFQTIYSSARRFSAVALNAASREMTLTTGAGVRLRAFYAPQPESSRGTVLLLHGWLGDSRAFYMQALGEGLFRAGFSVFRLNLRDHGGTEALNPGTFRSDRLAEVFDAARQAAQLDPARPLHVVGISLGGGFALRLAWQHSQTPIPNFGRTVGICPLINPLTATLALDRSPFYRRYFRRKWRQALARKQAAFPNRYNFAPEISAPDCMTMTEIFIRNHAPYANARDYFAHYTVTPVMMAALAGPVTIITADDDPIIPASDFTPLRDVSPHLTLSIQPFGGHVGFIDLFPFRYWLNEVLPELLR